MEQKSGAQISRKAFIQSALILLALMLSAGVLTRVVPSGKYAAAVIVDGRSAVDPQSFQYVARPDYPAWRWLLAPLEVLAGPDAATIIVIIIFILMVGVSFALLDKSGILRAVIDGVVRRFQHRRYLLLMAVSLAFMLLGAFFGIFEEVVPLIPIMVVLAYRLGWDTLTGLGMSILATNMGFSAAITNPFTIGLAQKIAGLPQFSGMGLRVVIFLVTYALLCLFLIGYAKSIERRPDSSLMYREDQATRTRLESQVQTLEGGSPAAGAVRWFLGWLCVILLVFLGSPFVPFLSSVSLPLVGLLFLVAGVGAALLNGMSRSSLWTAVRDGAGGIAPGIPLILMAASVKYIITSGGIMDTLLHASSQALQGVSPFAAVLTIYLLALGIEFFVGSSSAKVFLLMPILFPLADLLGVTRQTVVTAYCFGDGFTNLIYPTNAVLLISLGLVSVPYSRWLKWTARLWLWMLPVTVIFLAIATAISFGPF